LPATRSTHFPYTTLFRSRGRAPAYLQHWPVHSAHLKGTSPRSILAPDVNGSIERLRFQIVSLSPRERASSGIPFGRNCRPAAARSEENTSELKSRENLVC